MNAESIVDFPTPPRCGVVPQPNATEPTFAPEHDRLMTVVEAASYVRVTRYRIDSALKMNEIRYVNLGPATAPDLAF